MRNHILGRIFTIGLTSGLAFGLLGAVLTPAPALAAGDPHDGKFTLADATKGLSGNGKLTATIATTLGTFTCELFEEEAPLTVANFVGLARGLRHFQDPKTEQWVKRPFYDGLVFHRVIPGFMIQGGDAKGNGTGDPGYSIPDEKNAHKFDKGGMLAMANRGPNTGGSQFFITEKDTPFLDDGAGPGHYQIFGQCNDPALVKKIASVERNGERPKTDVKITKVTISRKGGGAKKAAAPAEKAADKGGAKPAEKK